MGSLDDGMSPFDGLASNYIIFFICLNGHLSFMRRKMDMIWADVWRDVHRLFATAYSLPLAPLSAIFLPFSQKHRSSRLFFCQRKFSKMVDGDGGVSLADHQRVSHAKLKALEATLFSSTTICLSGGLLC